MTEHSIEDWGHARIIVTTPFPRKNVNASIATTTNPQEYFNISTLHKPTFIFFIVANFSFQKQFEL